MNNGGETKYSFIALQIDEYAYLRQSNNRTGRYITHYVMLYVAGTTGSYLHTLIFMTENRKGLLLKLYYCHRITI